MLIGLTGYKGVGKDTAAQWLIDEQGYVKLAFADKLKEAVANLFGLTLGEVELLKNDLTWVSIHWPLSEGVREMSFRELLQRFGTEMGRHTFGEDFWVEIWEREFYDINTTTGRHIPIVATDVRFENEAQKIHELEGKLIRVMRPGYDSDGHASEVELPSHYIDAVVMNEGTIEDFHTNLAIIMEGIWN